MKKVIIASHGDLSKGMLHSVKMIISEPQCEVETYSLYPGDSATDYAVKVKQEALSNPDKEFVIIADVLGGSVHTALSQIVDVVNISLFSGMNMGLVLEVITNADKIAPSGNQLVEAGRDGITFIDSIELNTEVEDF